MNTEKVEFTLEEISKIEKISRSVVSGSYVQPGYESDDFMKNLVTFQIGVYFYTNMAETRNLTFYCPRPTFLDWLFRRTKRVIFKLEVKDLLLNPPKMPDRTKRIYIVKKID